MNHPAKRLCQQRATLTARQGDPQSPASGTLYARRQRLAHQLEAMEVVEAASSPAFAFQTSGRSSVASMSMYRSSSEVQRELAAVDREIDDLQKQIDDIDRLLVRSDRKH